jgi:hypothetical protein
MKIWPAVLAAVLALVVYCAYLYLTTDRFIVSNTNFNLNINSWPLYGDKPNTTSFKWPT